MLGHERASCEMVESTSLGSFNTSDTLVDVTVCMFVKMCLIGMKWKLLALTLGRARVALLCVGPVLMSATRGPKALEGSSRKVLANRNEIACRSYRALITHHRRTLPYSLHFRLSFLSCTSSLARCGLGCASDCRRRRDDHGPNRRINVF
ncbi:hypothetical protein EVAR_81768_1 [Eumeta japonica]|uniref:Uncharacterized protein n=1 Tax=Eumeta variegata TaxID=151549 RepID=A0A4C1UHJ3_EUMVA|nr:hypothetical protein EVAR_81768_1 [Eumeta japonica]